MSPGKTIVVTGGASGIGLALTRSFATYPDVQIAIFDINPTSGANVLSDLRTEFPAARFAFHQCNIASWEEQAAVFEAVYGDFGSVDVVVANAGVLERGDFVSAEEGKPVKPDLTTIDINLVGTLYTIHLAIHYMRQSKDKNPGRQGSGCIVCTASNAGFYPLPMAPLYGASKHGVVGAVRSLSRPLQKAGIRINAIAPAPIATNIAGGDKSFLDAMVLTPVSSAVAAVEELVKSEGLNGMIAEVHGDNFTFRPPLDYVDAESERNMEYLKNLV